MARGGVKQYVHTNPSLVESIAQQYKNITNKYANTSQGRLVQYPLLIHS